MNNSSCSTGTSCCGGTQPDKAGCSTGAEEVGGLTCFAVTDGVNVWLWDVRGIPRRYNLATSGINKKKNIDDQQQRQQQFTTKKLCFGTHNTSNVADLLTPCLDEDGRHGVPLEDCFCGEEEPHLHAHWHHPQGCKNNNMDKKKKNSASQDVERLADLMLLSRESGDGLDQEEKDEGKGSLDEPSSPSFKTPILANQHAWPCQNSRHLELRHQEKALIWQNDTACTDCTTNTKKLNQQQQQEEEESSSLSTAVPLPSFTYLGGRTWKNSSTKQPVNLHFFHVGRENNNSVDSKENASAAAVAGDVVVDEDETEDKPSSSYCESSSSCCKKSSSMTSDKPEKPNCCSQPKSGESDCCASSEEECSASLSKSNNDVSENKQSCCSKEKVSGGDCCVKEKDCCATSNVAATETSCCAKNQEKDNAVTKANGCCAPSAKQAAVESGCCAQQNESSGSFCLGERAESDCCNRQKSSSSQDGCCTSKTKTPEESPSCCLNEKHLESDSCNIETRSSCCDESDCCSQAQEKDCCVAMEGGCNTRKQKDTGGCSRQPSPCCKEQSKSDPGPTEISCAYSSADCCNGNINAQSSCGEKSDEKPDESPCCIKELNEGARGGCCSSSTDLTVPTSELMAEHPVVLSGRSQFRVAGLCCASEIPVIRGALDGVTGIEKIGVNPTTKTVYVDHDPSVIPAEQITHLLNRKQMGAIVQIDAADSVGNNRPSLFVVSKFELVKDIQESTMGNKDRIDLVLKGYDKTQVESFVFDERSKVLTVVHNPWTIGTEDIHIAAQERANILLDILLNGSNHDRAPLDYASLANSKLPSTEDSDGSQVTTWPKANVVMSGLLWLMSMLSFIGGNFEYLKYVALASVAFGLPPILRKAIGTLSRQFRFDTNGLMSMASIGALALAEFPEAGAVVFLFALSEWLEQRASSRARMALSAIVNLRPDKARIIDAETQQLWTIPATAVPVGALVSVKTGDKIPCDGIVVEGQSTVDESSLTGESRPIFKGPKATVSGGTVNTGLRQLVVRTTSTSDDSAVARLIRLVEEAQSNRSETEKAIDEFAKFYTPLVLFVALLMCTIPWAYGVETGKKWTHNGLVLIVVACPCALIISTPVSYVAGLAAAAQRGILIKGGAYLEALGQVRHICFDKTGTLTTGEFCLLHLDIVGESLTRHQVLEYLLLMEERAAHPVAQAIMTAARNENVSIPKEMILEKHTILAGEGVTGVINGKDVFVGNERLFERLGLLVEMPKHVAEKVVSWKRLGGTIGFIAIQESGIVGAYCAADAVRPEAAEVVQKFLKRGIALHMLTGDNDEAAKSVGAQLGWHSDSRSEIYAKLLPADKLKFVEELAASKSHSCFRKHIVLFCGDGVNDAPALAAAHVGVAMGSGAVVAMETAHVTLLDTSLHKLDFAQQIGRRVLRKIAENVAFSIAIKLAVLVWAVTGTPSLWFAIGSDVGSMLLVTLNSMLLLPKRSEATPPKADWKTFA